MFNIYYINYAKAYEIAMLIDNKILEGTTKQKETEGALEGRGEAGMNGLQDMPFIGNYMPKIALEGQITGTKLSKVIDTVKVVSTKSTILDSIYKKAKEVNKLQDKIIGNLIKIKNVSLEVKNESDIIGTKTMLSGAFGDIDIEGMGSINLVTLLETMFKDSSYILEGTVPKERFKEAEKIIIKIPMQAENEMENQYNLSDLEIGKVTVIGIYRGSYDSKELYKKLNRFTKDESVDNEIYSGIESDDVEIDKEDNRKVHYLDIISIVQDISF